MEDQNYQNRLSHDVYLDTRQIYLFELPPEYIAQKVASRVYIHKGYIGTLEREERNDRHEKTTSLSQGLDKRCDHKSKSVPISLREREGWVSKLLNALAFPASQMRHNIAIRMKGQTESSRPCGTKASQSSEVLLARTWMRSRCQILAASGHAIKRWSMSSWLKEHLGQSAFGVIDLWASFALVFSRPLKTSQAKTLILLGTLDFQMSLACKSS